MKIKLAILENDQNYLNRIVSAFSVKYPDNLEVYSFTNMDMAISSIDSSRIDILIADSSFEIDVASLPKRCGFAYLVDSTDIDMLNSQRAICRFQKADLIYRQILSIYSENAGNLSGIKLGDDSSKIIAFTSPSGGVGTSTVAAACALHFAQSGKKTLYLNLEKFGSSDLFFSGEGQFDLSDVIFALKSKKANLVMKLESCVKQDLKGVYFYSKTKVALDMLELSADDIIRLINELKISGSYDYIILDLDFSMSKEMREILSQALSIIWIGDGSEASNMKIARAYTAFSIKENNEETPLTNRLSLFYNRFSSKTGETVGIEELKNVGGAPWYKQATTEQIIDELSKTAIFDKIC